MGPDPHGGDGAPTTEQGDGRLASKDVGTSQQATHVDAWLKEVTEAVKEAQQSGVAPFLIDHAKMKIREKRRECQAREKAIHDLQISLSRKQPPKHELLRNLQKVQRLGGHAGNL